MMKKIFIFLCFFCTMCNRYPDNRNKDRNPDAQTDADTVMHPDSKRDSSSITDPNIGLSQRDSAAGPVAR
jgi:hypothetical protein